MEQQLRRQRTAILALGAVTLLFMGMLYGWSVFVRPLEAEFGWNRAETSVTYTISLVCFSLGLLLEGFVANRKSHRFAAVLGAVLVPLGFVLCSFTSTMLHLFIFYGVFCGLGIGISYNAWLATVISWFPDRQGTATGLALLGYGLGGMVMGSAASAIIHSALGWRRAFLTLGIAVLIESALALRFMKAPPAELHALLAPSGAGKRPIRRRRSLTTGQMLREGAFWSGILWKCLLYCSGIALVGQASPIIGDTGAAVAVCTLGVGLLSFGNGLGRILIGGLFDRIGTRKVMILVSAGYILLSLAYFVTYRAGLTAALVAVLFVTGIFYGGISVMSSTFVSATFGTKYFGVNMGVGSAMNIPFIFFLSSAISLISARTGAYTDFFYLLFGISVLSLALALATDPLIRRMDARYDAAGESAGAWYDAPAENGYARLC
ncbi:MAG TPA: MFS transporter [Oscillospiraceae bacterium]|nr:MFS transporter [Oscillospiraceae bacterium]